MTATFSPHRGSVADYSPVVGYPKLSPAISMTSFVDFHPTHSKVVVEKIQEGPF